MRARRLSLAAKLNLALLAFFLALGAATVVILLYGFNRTRDNADARSNEALERGGELALRAVAGGAAEQGGILFESAAEIGGRAALYVEAAPTSSGATTPALPLERAASGHYYDPNPERVTDVVVLASTSPDSAPVQDDITFSAPLEAILPVLLQSIAGEVSGRNFDPTSIVFVSPAGVARYYPPTGIQDLLPPDTDFEEQVASVGPDQNPERRTIWTAPYEDFAGQGLVVTARTPVYVGDSFRGAVEIDVPMANIIAQVDQIKPTPGGFAFYVDSQGALTQSIESERLSAAAETNSDLAAVLEDMAAIEPGDYGSQAVRLPLEGQDYYLAYAQVPGLGGTLAAAAPVSDITAAAAPIASGIDDEATRTLQVMLAAMAVLFVLGLLAAGVLNRNAVVRPINSLVSAARAVGSGDLNARVDVAEGGDELTELGVAFNSMVDQLRESERALEERVEQRTRELQALLDTSKSLSSTLELEQLLDDILNHLQALIECDGAAVLLVEGDRLVQLAVRRPQSMAVDTAPVGNTAQAYSDIWRTIERGEPVVIDDVRGDSPMAQAYRGQMQVDLDLTPVAYVRAWAAVPLTARDQVIGMLAIAHKTPGSFDQRDIELATAVAAQAAVAIENARLFEDTRRQARDMEALSRADAELFRSLSLDEVLQALVDVAVDVVGADKSIVMLHEGMIDVIRASRNFSREGLLDFTRTLSGIPHEEPDGRKAKPEYFDDIRKAPKWLADGLLAEGVEAHLSIPVRIDARMLGAFGVSYAQSHHFADDEVSLFAALADRAAVAIQNAELYERAQQAASLEERQRLARELHDSVSQALFGIALGAQTARLRIDNDPATAAEPIEYVMSLAQAGLAEMRALIFELRPESLENEGLVAAIEKQVAALQTRHSLAITMDLIEEPECKLDVKEALYRISQEALHNVVKHAQATNIDVRLERDGTDLCLTIKDDGRGFDATASYPGHVGLLSMPERAARLGGSVEIESEPGAGTTITARLPV